VVLALAVKLPGSEAYDSGVRIKLVEAMGRMMWAGGMGVCSL
jgi:hypothetical protein